MENTMQDQTSLLASILTRLLRVDVRIWTEGDAAPLNDFERLYCFAPSVQPFYRSRNLALLLSSAKEECIYELQDQVGTCLILFRFGGQVLFVGPYVQNPFDPLWARQFLAKHHESATRITAFQLYYTALPLISLQAMLHTLKACLGALGDDKKVYAYQPLRGIQEQSTGTGILLSGEDQETFEELKKSYEAENAFSDAIAAGDVDGMLAAYHEMGHRPPQQTVDTFISHADPVLGLTVVRTLARKAAERGGLSILDINRITQKAVQCLRAARTFSDQNRITKDMLVELAEAVRAARERLSGCSFPVRQCLEYIRLHFSNDIRISQLTELTGLSASRISTLFREETGRTVTDWIRSFRCQEAAQLLKNSDLAIQEISTYVGYPDNNYFVKVFRREMGCTPSDYRAGKDKSE
ncbi:MAG: helix-turn-helix transcriptional regulator [Lachnospiraceae bacterium]